MITHANPVSWLQLTSGLLVCLNTHTHTECTLACRRLVWSSEIIVSASGLRYLLKVIRLYFFQLSPLPPSVPPSQQHFHKLITYAARCTGTRRSVTGFLEVHITVLLFSSVMFKAGGQRWLNRYLSSGVSELWPWWEGPQWSFCGAVCWLDEFRISQVKTLEEVMKRSAGPCSRHTW